MNLDQDAINALLKGGDDVETAEGTASAASDSDIDLGLDTPADGAGDFNFDEAAASTGGDLLNPDEISALFNVVSDVVDDADIGSGELLDAEYQLDAEEKDLLGEVGNICMGAVATTMYTLLDRRVSITTPRVSVHTTKDVLSVYKMPFVVVEVGYTAGLNGKNIFVIKEVDAAMITDILMGGDGTVEEPVELNELHMSAINEIMNQMMGASATAMSKLLGEMVDISTPISNRISENDSDISGLLNDTTVVIKVFFDMEIEGLLNSSLMQLMPFKIGRDLAKRLRDKGIIPAADTSAKPVSAPEPQPAASTPAPVSAPAAPAQDPNYGQAPGNQPPYPYPPQPYPPQPYPQQGGYPPPPPPGYGYPPQYAPAAYAPQQGNLVDVHPMKFGSFEVGGAAAHAPTPMDLVYDIPLQVTIELGKTKKQISEILDFSMGTIIVLEKMAGDPVEVLVNGKLIARGEVVVIDENYGVRITEIITG